MNKSQFNHRVGSLMSTFQKVDSTIAGRHIEVKYLPSMAMHARTNYTNIEFGRLAIDENTISDANKIVALNGLNFHELCHVLYTPRHTDLPAEINHDRGMRMVFNALEDMRIESIFTGIYPDTKGYFRMAVVHHILNVKDADRTRMFPLLYGRKHLHKLMVDRFEKSYVEPDKVDEFKRVIDEYNALDGNIRKNTKTYIRLCKEYYDLLPKNENGDPNDGDAEPQGIQNLDPFNHDTDACAPKKSGNDKQILISVPEAIAQGSENVDGDSGDDGEIDPTTDVSDIKDPKAGGGGTKASRDASKAISDVLKQALKQIMEDVEIVNHVKTTRNVMMRKTGAIYGDKVEKENFTKVSPSPDIRNISNKVSGKYQVLVADSDPGYHTHQSNGRINIDRAMRNDRIDTVFDKWDEGKLEATDLEVVIGLDVSVSMEHAEHELSDVGWCLKNALGSLGERCTASVYTYSAGVYELYKRNESAGPMVRRIRSHGGTTPNAFLKTAQHIFTNTNRKHKILITMTDGDWHDRAESERTIRELNEQGVITGLYHYGHGRATHGAQVFHQSPDLSGLIKFSDNLVKLSMK